MGLTNPLRQNISPVLGAIYLKLEWFVLKAGLSPKRVKIKSEFGREQPQPEPKQVTTEVPSVISRFMSLRVRAQVSPDQGLKPRLCRGTNVEQPLTLFKEQSRFGD